MTISEVLQWQYYHPNTHASMQDITLSDKQIASMKITDILAVHCSCTPGNIAIGAIISQVMLMAYQSAVTCKCLVPNF